MKENMKHATLWAPPHNHVLTEAQFRLLRSCRRCPRTTPRTALPPPEVCLLSFPSIWHFHTEERNNARKGLPESNPTPSLLCKLNSLRCDWGHRREILATISKRGATYLPLFKQVQGLSPWPTFTHFFFLKICCFIFQTQTVYCLILRFKSAFPTTPHLLYPKLSQLCPFLPKSRQIPV